MPDVTRSFRNLDPQADRAALAQMLMQARDYYDLWLGHPPGEAEVEDALSSTPPGCDPAQSHRLGLFLDGVLSGVAELSFGYPTAEDAFLGLMILAPGARGAGHGEAFHDLVLRLARQRGCRRIYLGVLQANPRGKAFWHRMGYAETGVTRVDEETGHFLYRLGREV